MHYGANWQTILEIIFIFECQFQITEWLKDKTCENIHSGYQVLCEDKKIFTNHCIGVD